MVVDWSFGQGFPWLSPWLPLGLVHFFRFGGVSGSEGGEERDGGLG